MGISVAVTTSDLNINTEALPGSLEYDVPMDVLDNRLIADRAVASRGRRPLGVDRKLLHALFRGSERRARAAACRIPACHRVVILKFGRRKGVFAVSLTVQRARLLRNRRRARAADAKVQLPRLLPLIKPSSA
jgi:hypothetical protein